MRLKLLILGVLERVWPVGIPSNIQRLPAHRQFALVRGRAHACNLFGLAALVLLNLYDPTVR
ncbi:hypothetical protein [Luteimonas notoginsengisoli]|uniref:Uncharacterized protein n=1 Tax=Luteimonas notoginsengisoli TaxID=1578200 RepID=A0ABV7UXJ6_9GAMM